MTDIMISVIPRIMEVVVTSKSLMVRSVPNNLKRWIKDQAHENNVNQNSFVISKLQDLMHVREDRPLFADQVLEEVELNVDSFPFGFIDLFAGIGGFRIGLEAILSLIHISEPTRPY